MCQITSVDLVLLRCQLVKDSHYFVSLGILVFYFSTGLSETGTKCTSDVKHFCPKKAGFAWYNPWFTLKAKFALAFFHYHLLEAWDKPVGSYTVYIQTANHQMVASLYLLKLNINYGLFTQKICIHLQQQSFQSTCITKFNVMLWYDWVPKVVKYG